MSGGETKRKILGMMGKMEVLVREAGPVGIIELAGEIDIYNCGELRKLIDASVRSWARIPVSWKLIQSFGIKTVRAAAIAAGSCSAIQRSFNAGQAGLGGFAVRAR